MSQRIFQLPPPEIPQTPVPTPQTSRFRRSGTQNPQMGTPGHIHFAERLENEGRLPGVSESRGKGGTLGTWGPLEEPQFPLTRASSLPAVLSMAPVPVLLPGAAE